MIRAGAVQLRTQPAGKPVDQLAHDRGQAEVVKDGRAQPVDALADVAVDPGSAWVTCPRWRPDFPGLTRDARLAWTG
ncbi:hypothetical protein [Catellatospora citrea]|uniref:Uncharacterized protein n=1 Tax=Catellatospora citrea TaxID=53366 RepID=A0A8J3NYL4_9ACTN|nr:hypothetical protein [Catellatospora citrea]RKE05518.1 hypothetical protein C8E86_0319 [Catellatospora citrea]GIF96866.1 hypothetical protein Cci01nite_19600 [Catellatospora citrea]